MDALLTRPPEVDELDLERARIYGLLGRLLAGPPDAGLLDRIADLCGGSGTPLGRAIDMLAAAAAATPEADAEREYDALFIGVERGELVPYASYYLTGFLHDRPLAGLRREMQALGLERAPGVAEPEDHIAALCEMMAGLIAEAAEGGVAEGRFRVRHLSPWAGRFFRDLERAKGARLYRPVGALGRTFLEIEEAAGAMAPCAAGPGAARAASGDGR